MRSCYAIDTAAHVFYIDHGRMAWLIQPYKHGYMQTSYSAHICTQCYYICIFKALVHNAVHIILCAMHMQGLYLYMLYYIEFICRVVVKRSIIW